MDSARERISRPASHLIGLPYPASRPELLTPSAGSVARLALAPEGSPRPLRLLHVTARYLPYVGGTELHTYEVARRQAAAGLDVTVLTTDPSRRQLAAEHAEGVRIVRVPAWPASMDYHFAPAIYQIIVRGDWDIVHCQGYHTLVAPLAMVAAQHADIPYVVTFHSGGHSSIVRNFMRPFQRALLRPLLARARRLIGVSRFEADFFRKRLRLPRELFSVIPNGASLPLVDPPREPNASLIVSVGRLERYKGHHRVIQALPKIAAIHPDVRLRIVGSGPYEAALRQLARFYGVADRVEIGAIAGADRSAMAALIAQARLVMLLSDYESQAISVMEAISLGRPVLVADTSALRDIAIGGLARAVALDSAPEDIADEVLRQLDQPLIPAQVALPTWDACAIGLLEIYHAIVGRVSCAS